MTTVPGRRVLVTSLKEAVQVSSDALAVRPRGRLVLADLVPGERTRDLALVVGAAALVGLLAQVTIKLSFTPVPVTGQTLGVLLAGTALGWRRAGAAMVLYAGAGLAGVPWFAHHTSGWAGASFGYVLGFVLAAAACGFLAERGGDRTPFRALPTMVVGEVLVYAVGLPWLSLSLHVGLAKTVALGLTPFVAGDAIKAGIAAGLLPAAWRVARSRGRPA
jgi:biotin transport system substrate-specific component